MQYLNTPRGNLTIDFEFQNDREARSNGFGYYFSSNGYDIYVKHKADNFNSVNFAIVKREV